MSIKAYKGFNKDMTCRGFHFEEGKEYHEDNAVLCESGFHACENPLDCLKYYSPRESVYHEVELDELSEKKSDDSKICGKHIKIGARLNILNIANLAVKYINSKIDDKNTATNTGDRSAATVEGKDSVAITTGYDSKVKASLGSAICICERGEWNGETYPLLAIKAAIIDGETLKPDTWYKLKDGEFVEVSEDE